MGGGFRLKLVRYYGTQVPDEVEQRNCIDRRAQETVLLFMSLSLSIYILVSRSCSLRLICRYWWKSPDPEPAELPEVLLTRTGTFSRILLSFISRSSSITGGLYSTIDVDPRLSAFFASINTDAVVAATTNLVSPSCLGFPVDILLKTITRCQLGISLPLTLSLRYYSALRSNLSLLQDHSQAK
ncbi:hypothetical protein Bca52824_068281 [Brassica carinata]|uniref:Uncharacterized protein n=1 Tax=Brassica carinata TaxID=52824 RepID=A0A8X7Q184_BRACI|nr:hypothetical protein Bca52824_068281 [Brassica carinata]